MNKNILAKRTEVEPGVWGYSGKAGSGKLILSRIESKLSRSGLRQESDQLWLGTKENRRNNNKQQEKKSFQMAGTRLWSQVYDLAVWSWSADNQQLAAHHTWSHSCHQAQTCRNFSLGWNRNRGHDTWSLNKSQLLCLTLLSQFLRHNIHNFLHIIRVTVKGFTENWYAVQKRDAHVIPESFQIFLYQSWKAEEGIHRDKKDGTQSPYRVTKVVSGFLLSFSLT